MASPFVGGPERQVLGLARSLPPDCADRVSLLRGARPGPAVPGRGGRRRLPGGLPARRTRRTSCGRRREVADWLRRLGADVLCCSGYKPDLIGWLAARRAGVPVVAIAHGWTAATLEGPLLRGARPLGDAAHGRGRLRLGGPGRQGAPRRRPAGAGAGDPQRHRRRGFGPPDPARRRIAPGLFAERGRSGSSPPPAGSARKRASTC